MEGKSIIIEDEMEVVLEERYEDKVTGFVGVATAYVVYAHAPTLVRLENDGGDRWFEINRLIEETQR